MTINEAIKIKESNSKRYALFMTQEEVIAEKLGIEALNYINICRHNPNCFKISLLPGETEE